jgi:hypothetical protein
LIELATKNNVVGFNHLGIQVVDVDVAYIITLRDKNLVGKSLHGHSHVVDAISHIIELNLERVIAQSSVVTAGTGQSANAIDRVVTLDLTTGGVLKKGNELGVEVGGETETLEVGAELNGVLISAQRVEELRAIRTGVISVNDTVAEVGQGVGVLRVSGDQNIRVASVVSVVGGTESNVGFRGLNTVGSPLTFFADDLDSSEFNGVSGQFSVGINKSFQEERARSHTNDTVGSVLIEEPGILRDFSHTVQINKLAGRHRSEAHSGSVFGTRDLEATEGGF